MLSSVMKRSSRGVVSRLLILVIQLIVLSKQISSDLSECRKVGGKCFMAGAQRGAAGWPDQLFYSV